MARVPVLGTWVLGCFSPEQGCDISDPFKLPPYKEAEFRCAMGWPNRSSAAAGEAACSTPLDRYFTSELYEIFVISTPLLHFSGRRVYFYFTFIACETPAWSNLVKRLPGLGNRLHRYLHKSMANF